MSAPVDVLAVVGRLVDLAENSGGRRGEDEVDNEPAIALFESGVAARAAIAELIEQRDALAKWQREVAPLLAAAKSWMPTRKCAMHIREIDAALNACGGAA